MKDLTFLTSSLIAHRGVHNDKIEENTLLSFKRAIEKRYIIEFDVHMLKDETLVVYHDYSLKKLTGVNKIIEDLTYNELKKIKLKTGQMIPTLKEVLNLIDGKVPVIIELKGNLKPGKLEELVAQNLDEYKGLTHDNDQSYYYFMNQHLFSKVNIDLNHTYVPDGTIDDSSEACQKYDEIIKSTGGVDLQLLGLGQNGHIGFNEPAEVFPKGTHCVTLAKSTIEANARFFVSIDEVPTQAYTMGIQTIMNARRILMVVSGEDKADIVKKAFLGEVTPLVPASILQLHQDVTIVGDEAAFSKIIDNI